ncbi:anoctamin-1-like isoform X2 [Tachypleus tridentatus]|uniref:anoctamin-1-like isoform X2 n=1 Tax=Tachypleus tridentatus TaxID=6853 RepID=UPI003FD3823B
MTSDVVESDFQCSKYLIKKSGQGYKTLNRQYTSEYRRDKKNLWLLRVFKKWSVHKKGECVHENHAPTQWESDYNLTNREQTGLFGEYLEMVLQFGFVTIFVAAFPLAPLFALLNNIVEIRLDAKKFITFFRRLVAQSVKNIGIWYRILDSLGKFSVNTNALIIAFTSSFIDQIFYSVFISSDGSLNGFLNFTLSDFNVSDFSVDMKIISETNINVEYFDKQSPRAVTKCCLLAAVFLLNRMKKQQQQWLIQLEL